MLAHSDRTHDSPRRTVCRGICYDIRNEVSPGCDCRHDWDCKNNSSGSATTDGADLGIFYNYWGTVSLGNPADKDGSGTVDGADLARIYDSWTGDASPTSSVPEPTGSAMLVLSLVVLRRRS